MFIAGSFTHDGAVTVKGTLDTMLSFLVSPIPAMVLTPGYVTVMLGSNLACFTVRTDSMLSLKKRMVPVLSVPVRLGSALKVLDTVSTTAFVAGVETSVIQEPLISVSNSTLDWIFAVNSAPWPRTSTVLPVEMLISGSSSPPAAD